MPHIRDTLKCFREIKNERTDKRYTIQMKKETRSCDLTIRQRRILEKKLNGTINNAEFCNSQ